MKKSYDAPSLRKVGKISEVTAQASPSWYVPPVVTPVDEAR